MTVQRDRYPYSSAWDRPGFLLWHATMRWQRAAATALSPIGLTHAQFRLLCAVLWLKEHDGAWPSQRDLADHTGIDAMMTSQVVRALERSGYLQRARDEKDARVWRLQCTRTGRALALKAIRLVEAVDDRFFGPRDTRDHAVEVLRAMAGRDADGNLIDERWSREA